MLLSWKALRQNTLRGIARIRFPSGLEMAEIAVHVAGSRVWAAPPARPWIEDGHVVIDPATGRPKYQTLIGFYTHGCRSRWSAAVLDAVREGEPHALDADDGGAP